MAGSGQSDFTLRPMTMDDVPTVSRWLEHLPDLCLFDRTSAIPLNEASNSSIWEPIVNGPEPRRFYWFAAEDRDGQIVGISGLSDINYIHGDAVAALFVSQPGRRKGLGMRMTAMMVDLGFNQLRLERLTTYCREDNTASQELVAKLGFVREGVIRKAWYSGGKQFDIHAVGLLKEEWAEARRHLAPELDNGTKVSFGRPG